MDNNSLHIFDLLRSKKTPGELFLGCFNYTWEYMKVSYTADCTEALPLTLLDKTICGVLDIDRELTFGDLGAILGLNVDDDPEGGEFTDAAEYSLLHNAINSLLDYNMVERVFERGTLHLTDIGREYYRQGKKFRTTEAKSFSVYFDMTTGVHSKAKALFSEQMGNTLTTIIPRHFKDEQFLKAFIHDQLPDIYDPEVGNSFTNVSCPNQTAKSTTVAVQIGALYDVINQKYRFIPVLDDKVNMSLAEIIASNHKLLEELETKTRIMLSETALEEDPAKQESFEASVLSLLKEADANETTTLVIPQVIEPEEFWQGLSVLVGENDDKVFLKGVTLGETEVKAITALCDNHPRTNVFVSYLNCEEPLPTKHNLFSIQKLVQGDFILCTPSALYALRRYSLHRVFSNVPVDMVFRYDDVKEDFETLLGEFAIGLLPVLYTSTMKYLDSDFEVSKRSVRGIAQCDEKINFLGDYLSKEMADRLHAKKQEVYNRVKLAFEKTLIAKLDAVIAEKDIEEVGKVKELEEIGIKVDDLLKDGDETFILLMEKGRAFKQVLKERERTIKDEVLAKTYIIDTNVFLDDPDILSKINKPSRVILSGQVIQELDKKKNKAEDPSVSANARKAANAIKTMMDKDKGRKDRKKFISTDYGDLTLLPEELQVKKGDNFILSVAVKHRDENPWLLTSDNLFALTAESLGIPAVKLTEYYEKNGLENPKLADKPASSGPKTYMDVWEEIYDEKGTVRLDRFEKGCRSAGITPESLGFADFVSFVEAAPELTLANSAKGTTYVNLKR